MANITTGQYEVILRKKWKNENKELVPYRVRSMVGKKEPEKTYHTLELHCEIRKDIVSQDEIAGQRFTGQVPFIKVTDTNTQAVIQKNSIIIKSLYDSVEATSDFTPEDLAVYLIDKPLLLTLEVNSRTYQGNPQTDYIIKRIEKTKNPSIAPSALEDELSQDNEALQQQTEQELAELQKYDI